jgi:hypothetical protein
MENRKVKQVLSGPGTSGKGEHTRKGCRRVNVVEYYALVYENGKMHLLKQF